MKTFLLTIFVMLLPGVTFAVTFTGPEAWLDRRSWDGTTTRFESDGFNVVIEPDSAFFVGSFGGLELNLSQALSSAAAVLEGSFELPGSPPAGTIGGELVYGYDVAFWNGRSFSMSLSVIAPISGTPIEYFLGGPIVPTPEPETLALLLSGIIGFSVKPRRFWTLRHYA